jgi:hypothetical protein
LASTVLVTAEIGIRTEFRQHLLEQPETLNLEDLAVRAKLNDCRATQIPFSGLLPAPSLRTHERQNPKN